MSEVPGSSAQAETRRLEVQAQAEAERQSAQTEAEVQQVKTAADIRALREREQAAEAYSQHPALLPLLELETLRDLAQTANARIYVNFNGAPKDADEHD